MLVVVLCMRSWLLSDTPKERERGRELVVIWKWHAFRSSISANSQRGWRSVCVSPWILVAFFHFLHKKANAALLNHIHAHSSKALTSGSHLEKPVSAAPEFDMKQCG
jgi:hypothetical protein